MLRKNIFSIIVALIILYLSLASSETFESVPLFDISYFDKIVHFGMYCGFMSVIIFENRKSVKSNLQLFLFAAIPFIFGILMEVLQFTLTTSRSASLFDVLSNCAGILTSILLWLWIKPHLSGRIKL